MSKQVNLTVPSRVFSVPTSKIVHGIAYMGDDVIVNAHNSDDARKRVSDLGYKVNLNFEPYEKK